MKGYILLVLIGIIALGSCTKNKHEAGLVQSPDHLDLTITSQLDNMANGFSDIFNEGTFIPIDLGESLYLASLDELELDDDKWIILDRKSSQLLVCNNSGRLIKKIGELGSGPGEFQGLNDFFIDKGEKELIAFSNSDMSFYCFSLENGDFIKRVKLGMYGDKIEQVDKDSYLLYLNHNLSDKSGEFNLVLIDKKGQIRDKFFPIDPQKSNMVIPFSGFLTKSNGELLFSSPFSNEVFQFDGESRSFQKSISMNINSDYMEENKADFQKIVNANVLVHDKSVRFLGETFMKNNDFILFNYQYKSQRRFGLYSVKEESLKSFSKSLNDPLFKLLEKPLYLDEENFVYFGISSDQIAYLRTKSPDLYQLLNSETRQMFEENREQISHYVLKTKIKDR
ncbi:6-bladed beta-propeller [Echinicola sp. CAU 1574]|uniref:6-bladed beta-propeller n=1 Tax=Echinicola arenosa TaxID=2774144 RepID=A0ABR9AM07_9BACT|nr:6-bladed beta-propeller [Echinicola arenosa]MBD8489826.1 6-bladed beta-propeller [Echinicola arenosa]